MTQMMTLVMLLVAAHGALAQSTQGTHDQIVKQRTFVRSYLLKDGHLFLSLMADVGIYEFEPIRRTP